MGPCPTDLVLIPPIFVQATGGYPYFLSSRETQLSGRRGGADLLRVAGADDRDLDGRVGEDVFWVLKRLAPSLEARRAGLLEDRHAPALFALRDLAKDLNLAMVLFDGSAAQVPLTGIAAELVDAAAAESPDQEITAVIRPYRQVQSAAGSHSR